MDPVETKAYAAGYRAGRTRRKRENERAQEQAFLDRVFIALLPTAMSVEGWTIGNKTVVSGDDRMQLAAAWTRHARSRRVKV